MSDIQDQPAPIPSGAMPIWELVIADMRERDQVGRQRYGTPLQANNGRDALVDLYQELLDAVVYLRQFIAEGWCERALTAEERLASLEAHQQERPDGAE